MKVNPLLLLVFPLLFLTGSFVNAGLEGDFFKKVGQSISKPLQTAFDLRRKDSVEFL